MELYFLEESIKALKAKCKSAFFKDPDTGDRSCYLDSNHLDEKDFPVIRAVLEKEPHCLRIENKRILFKLKALETFKKSGVVKKLEILPVALKREIEKTKNRWLFVLDRRLRVYLPWFVTNIEYEPATVRGTYAEPAKVVISLSASVRGKDDTLKKTIRRENLVGGVAQILEEVDCQMETEAEVEAHERSLKKYRAHSPLLGEQYLGRGNAKHEERNADVSLEKDGVPAKLVMDDTAAEKEDDSGYEESDFWSGEESEEVVKLPIHPIVRMFNLRVHEFILVHVDSIEPYLYDHEIGRKLVLPGEHKSLIDALTLHAVERLDDIVRGKATGVIFLSKGPPGTGKTLSAEVYSEVAKRPLYMVQCSQLGTDPEELEEALNEVLSRAMRWKAILLIDEADVYIHERGTDLNQNAIVGIFLRLLEYYGGILFMTTNRGTAIDDAILSRCTAVIDYRYPEGDARDKIWRIIAAQYGVENLDFEGAIRAFPSVSGRFIRQVIRLSKLMANRKGVAVDIPMIKWAAQFQPKEVEKKEGL